MTFKKLALLVLLLPTLAAAHSPFEGEWTLRPQLSQWSADSSEQFSVTRGIYRCDSCNPKIDVRADGAEHSVANALGFDSVTVKQVNSRTMRIEKRAGGKVVREETYSVAPNENTLSLAFTDRSAPKEVVGHITFERVGGIVPQAQLMSGSWRPARLVDLGAGGKLSVASMDNGLRVTTGDGRAFEATFDLKDQPVDGSSAATVTLAKLNARTVQINHKQRGGISDVIRATVSEDGKQLTVIRADRRRNQAVTLVYDKTPDTVASNAP
jgi:hypothetical protein